MSRIKKDAAANYEDIVAAINSRFGEGSAATLGSMRVQQLRTVPTGSLSLDSALGVGGWPLGRIVEVYGSESSGKTTLALHTLANAQRAGMKCALIDAEHALDVQYARALGVDADKLVVSQPDYGEQALDILDMLVSSKQFGVVVIDSVAALTPKAEIDGDMEDQQMGLHARMMSKAMRKLCSKAYDNDTLLFFINQTRSKIGVTYGSPVTTTGGNALKFYASIRVQVSRTGSMKVADVATGNTTVAKVVKNKCAPPFREAEFEIDFGTGISIEGEIIDRAIEKGMLVKSGAWIKGADGSAFAQGREAAKTLLRGNPALRDAFVAALTAKPTEVTEDAPSA